jgi:hypothetical protein
MSNWIYIDDIEVTDKVNTIHVDTRDFHCSVREDKIDLRDARHPEITRVKHNSAYFIHQDEIKGFLKGLETITGGKGEWRQMAFKHCGGWWFKYVRMYRIKGEYFVVCDQDNVPVMWELMKAENLKDGEYLNHAHDWK